LFSNIDFISQHSAANTETNTHTNDKHSKKIKSKKNRKLIYKIKAKTHYNII